MSPFSLSLVSPLLLLLSPFLSFSFCLSGFLSTLNIIFPKHISQFYIFSSFFLLVQSACSPGEVPTEATKIIASTTSTICLCSEHLPTQLPAWPPLLRARDLHSSFPERWSPSPSHQFPFLHPSSHFHTFLSLGPLPSFLSFPFASCLPQVPSQDGVSWGPRPEHPPRACEMSFTGFPSPVLTKAVPAEKTGTRTSDFSSCACFLHKWLPYNNPSSVGNWETLLGHTTNCLSMLFQAAFL